MPLPLNPTLTQSLSLSGASIQLANPQAKRQWLVIQNYLASASPMYISLATAATLGLGGEFELQPGGIMVWGTPPSPFWSPNNSVIQLPGAPPDAVFINSAGATGMAWEALTPG